MITLLILSLACRTAPDSDSADSEALTEWDCDDLIDNDGDGDVDCADAECAALPECEPPLQEICDNGVDDDRDEDVDCRDSDCRDAPECQPTPEVCDNGVDDDLDGATDCDDADCEAAPECAPPPEEVCDNGADDDGDGAVDCDDPDCQGDAACPRFAPLAYGLSWTAGYDGEALTSFAGVDGSGVSFEVAPSVTLDFYEERYFDTSGDERFRCTWTGEVVEATPAALPTLSLDGDAGLSLWSGWQVRLRLAYVDDGTGTPVPDSDCEGFDPLIWGARDPTAALEGLTWGLGVAELDPLLADFYSSNFSSEWDAGDGTGWAYELIGSYYDGAQDPSDLHLLGPGSCGGFEAEWREGTLSHVYDADGQLAPRLLGQGWDASQGLPADTILSCSSIYLPYASNLQE